MRAGTVLRVRRRRRQHREGDARDGDARERGAAGGGRARDEAHDGARRRRETDRDHGNAYSSNSANVHTEPPVGTLDSRSSPENIV